MKTSSTFWTLVVVAWVGVLFLSGCTLPSANQTLPLKVTKMDVDWKLTAYQQAVDAQGVTEGQKQQVAAANQAFQTAYAQAVTAAKGDLHTSTPPAVAQLATQLISVIDTVLP
jgi:fructose-bisphosphate aldolase class 1